MKIKISKFKDRVIKIVRDIPKGKVLTYKQVATMSGSPSASRAVGNIMKANYDKTVPCHRVIRSDGKVGDYNSGGSSTKLKKLKAENWNGKLVVL